MSVRLVVPLLMSSKNKSSSPLTYISLFSSAGVGCYGFQQAGFECVASVEIIGRRIDIQRHNAKCLYDTGYIADDIRLERTKQKIRDEIELWARKHGVPGIDVIVATPPCQGMSVANHKKKDELGRNSLVVESVRLVNEMSPKFFVFENVRGFLNSMCTDIDGADKRIRQMLEYNLGGAYNIHHQTINFKEYGNPSSRTRTIVLGIRKDLADITPLDFMPTRQTEQTVRSVIGNMSTLSEMGDIDSGDIYHSFKPYSQHMLEWIKGIKEGESAFDNKIPAQRPHKIINNKLVFNTRKNGDKYTRCFWDRPGPCIHTRNDILSSQSTIHPTDNRVFSIRELMHLMSIPSSFKWSSIPLKQLNALTMEEKRKFLKKEEINIRQSIGESVPTVIFHQIATKMKIALQTKFLDEKQAEIIILQHGLHKIENLKKFLIENRDSFNFSELSKIVELTNAKRRKHAAYYTRQDVCFTVVKHLPDASCFRTIRILEPSVGAGNFLPLLIKKYRSVDSVTIDLIDIDKNILNVLKLLLDKLDVPENITINLINDDFLLHNFFDRYDIVVGNPPFQKITNNEALLSKYKRGKLNRKTNNVFSFFLENAVRIADTVSLIIPKSFLSTPEFDNTRQAVSKFAISKIVDYGEHGFKGVKIETICLTVDTKRENSSNTASIESYITRDVCYKQQHYICSSEFPYWLIYRNDLFDTIASRLRFGIFRAYRDRQITKRVTYPQGQVRVLKSRNIGNNEIINLPDYDSYMNELDGYSVAKYLNSNNAVLVPNLTYNPRACFLPKNAVADGSVAVLVVKDDETTITAQDLNYYNSREFTEFYRIARNRGTRSLNVDNNSVFFFGLRIYDV